MHEKMPLNRFALAIGSIFVLGNSLLGSDDIKLPEAARKSVEAAVVWIEDTRGRSLGTGVCIANDGLVIFRNTTDLRVPTVVADEVLKLHFSNGNEATAHGVGWSDAWGIGVARINSGKFPNITMRDTPNGSEEQCFSAEFIHSNERVSLSWANGIVKRTYGTWFDTDIKLDGFAPIFDVDGKLIGITSEKGPGYDSSHTAVSIIAKLIGELSTCQNIDKQQALREAQMLHPKPPQTIDVRQLVRDTSVQICPIDNKKGNNGWTGTSIGDGLIATCGHHNRSPGTEVTIRFSNGQIAHGMTLGLNPILDVGLVRITDEGRWPTACIAKSTELKVGETCFFGGYPASGNKLVEVDAMLVEPERLIEPKAYIWGHIFFTDGSYETFGGMSGSGVFNNEGFLVGIHVGRTEGLPGRHIRIEFLTENLEAFLHQDR